MSAAQPIYDAYLLRTWQEDQTEDSSAATCYYLLEELFGARQRWLFTDVAEFHQHLQIMLAPSSLPARKGIETCD